MTFPVLGMHFGGGKYYLASSPQLAEPRRRGCLEPSSPARRPLRSRVATRRGSSAANPAELAGSQAQIDPLHFDPKSWSARRATFDVDGASQLAKPRRRAEPLKNSPRGGTRYAARGRPPTANHPALHPKPHGHVHEARSARPTARRPRAEQARGPHEVRAGRGANHNPGRAEP